VSIERQPASAIVLAGGRASRFGGPKLSTVLDGVPLLDWAIRGVAPVAAEVVVVGRHDEAPDLPAAAVPMRLVHDPEPDGGPLVALATGLRAAGFPAALVVGGDMPRLRSAVLETMLERLGAGGCDAVLLAPPGGAPPGGAVPRQTLPLALACAPGRAAAARALTAGRRSLQALLDELVVAEIPAAAWLRLDPAAGTLDDVDEPADLERIARGGLDLHREETST